MRCLSVVPGLVIGWLWLAGVHAACPDRAELALSDLERTIGGELTGAQRAEAFAILQSLCAPPAVTTNAEGDTVYKTVSPSTREPARELNDDEEVSLLGIKIRRADEDSKGHERLRRKR